MSSSALTFSSIANNVPSTLSSLENQITSLTNGNTDLTSAQLFQLQQYVTQWSLASSTFTTVLKTLGDTLKGTLQKIN